MSEFPAQGRFSPIPTSGLGKEATPPICDLCGLPQGRTKISQVLEGKTFHFCCPGCRQVFLILFNRPDGRPDNFRETELYRACVRSGIIPRDEKDLAVQGTLDESKFQAPTPLEGLDKNLALDLALKVEGMWCQACSWIIEEVLKKTEGIIGVKVFFLSDTAQIKYLPQTTRPDEIMARISGLGYRPSFFDPGAVTSPEKKDLLRRLGISVILTAHIMMLSFALYFGFFQELSRGAVQYLSYPLWLMATPVVFYGGLPIFRKAIAGVAYGSTSMETLISIGALAAYLYSFFQMAKGSIHLYFDTASMLITIVLLGKYIESQARAKVSGGITDLYRLANQKVRLFTPASDLGHQGEKETWISSKDAKVGDQFLVLAGERVPLDSRVISGWGDVDESTLTGEARPVRKIPGQEALAGVLVLNGELALRATRVGPESSLGQMITLMEEALSKKNPAELLADRLTRWFVPAIIGLAAFTAAFLWIRSFSVDEALLRSLTVMVISCPCALGIATPIVKVAAMGLAKSKGILIRDPGALERVKSLDTLIFDKTGTLTEGNFSLKEVVVASEISESEAFSRVASVEVHSNHFLAKEITRQAREKHLIFRKSESFECFEGMGIKGMVDGREIFIGNRSLINRFNMNLPSAQEQKARNFEAQGMTIVFFGWQGEVQGFFVFGDSLKRGIREMISRLHEKRMAAWVVSGDAEATTRAIAGESGITKYIGQALPQDKVGLIKSLQSKGHRVGMVGDGINDAAALTQADVGFALGMGDNILQEASDLTFLTPDPIRILEAIDLSTLTVRAIRQNLFFAFLYNSFGIPLAIAGLLNPLVAVLAMFASSLTVIGNGLRVAKTKN